MDTVTIDSWRVMDTVAIDTSHVMDTIAIRGQCWNMSVPILIESIWHVTAFDTTMECC
jgi:hypothetical protein